MKKLFFFLICSFLPVYAVQSIKDATAHFQERLKNYLQDKDNRPELAQAVVAEYTSTENTDKYRRVFDSILTANKTSITAIKNSVLKKQSTAPQIKKVEAITKELPAKNFEPRIRALKADLGTLQKLIDDHRPGNTAAEIKERVLALDDYNDLFTQHFQGKEFLKENIDAVKRNAQELFNRISRQ